MSSKETSRIPEAQGEAYLVLRGVPPRYAGYDWALRFERVVSKKPAVGRDEIALQLRIRVPAALFEKPTLGATISVNGDVPQMDLTPETVTTVQDLIRAQTGLDVQLTVVKP